MAFVPVNLVPGVGKVRFMAQGGTVYTVGELLKRQGTAIVSANAGAIGEANISNLIAIATKTQTLAAGTGFVDAIPLQAVTFVVADCNADTADNQLNLYHALTSATLVNNSSTIDATTAGVFFAVNRVGTPGTRKLFGYLITGPQNV